MSTIERINRLKQQAFRLSERVRGFNPLGPVGYDHVSRSGLTFSDLDERLNKISGCASVVELRDEWENGGDGLEQKLSVSAANYCKQHVVCPICADRSQSRRRARFDSPIKSQAKMVHEKKRFAYMLTFTVTDGPDLSERLMHLKNAVRNFRRMGQRRKRGRSCGEAGKIRAAISTVEIKRGESSGLWHVHAHSLAFSDSPIDYEVYDREKRRGLSKKYGANIPKEVLDSIAKKRIRFHGELVPVSKISEEWLRSTGDSIGIHVDRLVHVPEFKTVLKNGHFVRSKIPSKKRRILSRMSFEESIAYQSRECLKYFTKTNENSPGDIVTIVEDTYNKRLVATYGEFRAIGGDDYNDPADPDGETWVLKWDPEAEAYSNPVPGRLRDTLEEEEAHKARSLCGRLTGQYRRVRRYLVGRRDMYRSDLAGALDGIKQRYRESIREVWAIYRQAVESAKRTENAMCDKYSPLFAAAGIYLPGSDSRDVYASVFT